MYIVVKTALLCVNKKSDYPVIKLKLTRSGQENIFILRVLLILQ